MDCIVIHYSEIGLKGSNRPYFEKKLLSNIKQRTRLEVKREYGRLIMEYGSIKELKLIPGIAYYATALKAKLDIKDIIKKAKKLVTKDPFRVTTKRSNKSFKHTSPEVNRMVGEALYKKGLKVDLHKPKTELFNRRGERIITKIKHKDFSK